MMRDQSTFLSNNATTVTRSLFKICKFYKEILPHHHKDCFWTVNIKKSTYIYTFKERNDSFDIKISINKDKNMSNLLQKNQRSEFKSAIQIFDRILGILHILILWGGNLVTVECHPAYLGDLPTSIFGFELFQKASRTMLRFVKCSSTKVLIKEGEFLGTCFVVIPPFHQRMVLFFTTTYKNWRFAFRNKKYE